MCLAKKQSRLAAARALSPKIEGVSDTFIPPTGPDCKAFMPRHIDEIFGFTTVTTFYGKGFRWYLIRRLSRFIGRAWI